MKISIWILTIFILCIPINVKAQPKLIKAEKISKEEIFKLIYKTSKEENVPVEIALTFVKIESDFKQGAFNGNEDCSNNSCNDCQSHGLFQLTFNTAKRFNKNIKTTKDVYITKNNVRAGIKFIKYLLVTYPKLSIGEIAQIYNLGETKYNVGIRNDLYKEKFLSWYRLYKDKTER